MTVSDCIIPLGTHAIGHAGGRTRYVKVTEAGTACREVHLFGHLIAEEDRWHGVLVLGDADRPTATTRDALNWVLRHFHTSGTSFAEGRARLFGWWELLADGPLPNGRSCAIPIDLADPEHLLAAPTEVAP